MNRSYDQATLAAAYDRWAAEAVTAETFAVRHYNQWHDSRPRSRHPAQSCHAISPARRRGRP